VIEYQLRILHGLELIEKEPIRCLCMYRDDDGDSTWVWVLVWWGKKPVIRCLLQAQLQEFYNGFTTRGKLKHESQHLPYTGLCGCVVLVVSRNISKVPDFCPLVLLYKSMCIRA